MAVSVVTPSKPCKKGKLPPNASKADIAKMQADTHETIARLASATQFCAEEAPADKPVKTKDNLMSAEVISPSTLTRELVEEHRRWLLRNAGDTDEVDAYRQYFDKRLGARRRIEVKERLCTSINRRRYAEASKREAAQIEAAPTGMPIDSTRAYPVDTQGAASVQANETDRRELAQGVIDSVSFEERPVSNPSGAGAVRTCDARGSGALQDDGGRRVRCNGAVRIERESQALDECQPDKHGFNSDCCNVHCCNVHKS